MLKNWLQTKTTASRATALVLLCLGVVLFCVIYQSQLKGFYLPGIPESYSDDRQRYPDSVRSKSSNEKSTMRIHNKEFKAYSTESFSNAPATWVSSVLVSASLSTSKSSYSSLGKSTKLLRSFYRSRRPSSRHMKVFSMTNHYEKANETNVHDFEMSLNDMQFTNYLDLHQARIQRIKDACSKEKMSKTSMYRATSTVIYKSQIYNFTFCKVPKGGSTFWTKVFGVLKYGVSYADYVFKISRNSVHRTMDQYVTTMSKTTRDQSKTILVSRCPYSRLFSAYIDKSFLQLLVGINYSVRNISKIAKYKGSCQTNVTFQEFLDWVILEGKRGKTLNRHWAPIVSLCFPCRMNPYILIKQETFANDVKFALEQLGVEKEKYDYIAKALHEHRAELSLPGIISTLLQHSDNPVIKQCLGFKNVARRIWISLQIQGFIDERIDFPVALFKQNQFSNSTFYTGIVLQTINDHPMNTSQSTSQRQRFLYKAYRSIDPKTIKDMQEMFKQDFEIFGYSKLPPTEV